MIVKPCRPYHGVDAGRTLVRMPDGRSAFKIYYVSIVGRDQPERYEWDRSDFTREAFEARFVRSGLSGIGFVTAFPHITKVFSFAPAMETVLHVQARETRTLEPMGLDRGDGWVEFACYAEAALAADEYRAWAGELTVDAYLESFSSEQDWPIADHAKLAAHVRAGA